MPIFNVLLDVDTAALLLMATGNALLCASALLPHQPAVLTCPRPTLGSTVLALMFPLNIIIAMPIYFQLIHCFWG